MPFQPPRGMRDFPPEVMIKRMYVIEKIRETFERYGFSPVCTSAVEYWKVLSRKGGGGEAIKEEIYYFKDKGDRELGLRFDLTTSLARFVSGNPQIPKPFKVYQIGRVWRYDRPQAGRYREFWQADADIIGSPFMDCEAECIALASECLQKLGFENFEIRINNRKVLNGMMEFLGIEKEKQPEVFRILDKLDKIGENGVKKELENKGVKNKTLEGLLAFARMKGKPEKIIEECMQTFAGFSEAEEGLKELREIIEKLKPYNISGKILIDLSLVRGLDYYTGPIFEIEAKGKENLGSISAGGRYDKFIEVLGGKPTPAVGVSLGIERIFDILEEKSRFTLPQTKTEIFVVSVEDSFRTETIKIAQELRRAGFNVETDLMSRNLKKQLEHINRTGIPYALFVGQKEIKTGRYTLRDMNTGKQKEMSVNEIIKELADLRG